MLDDLYDLVSRCWWWLWPSAEGKVTRVLAEHHERRIGETTARLSVAYQFSVGDDGPYTGECFWAPHLLSMPRVTRARRKLHRNQRVRVRYRRDDPSVNTLDGGVRTLLRHSELIRFRQTR